MNEQVDQIGSHLREQGIFTERLFRLTCWRRALAHAGAKYDQFFRQRPG